MVSTAVEEPSTKNGEVNPAKKTASAITCPSAENSESSLKSNGGAATTDDSLQNPAAKSTTDSKKENGNSSEESGTLSKELTSPTTNGSAAVETEKNGDAKSNPGTEICEGTAPEDCIKKSTSSAGVQNGGKDDENGAEINKEKADSAESSPEKKADDPVEKKASEESPNEDDYELQEFCDEVVVIDDDDDESTENKELKLKKEMDRSTVTDKDAEMKDAAVNDKETAGGEEKDGDKKANGDKSEDVEMKNAEESTENKKEEDSEQKITEGEIRKASTELEGVAEAGEENSDPNCTDKKEGSGVKAHPIVTDVRRLDKGLPNFLRKRVRVGKWTPCEMPKNGEEFRMGENEALVEVPSLTVPLLIHQKDVFARRVTSDGTVLPPKPRKPPSLPSQNQFKLGQTSVVDFFSCTAGEFLMEIGLDRVSEAYHKDQLKQKEREHRKHGVTTELLEAAKNHAEKYQVMKAKNSAFHHDLKKCKTCDFETESQLVLEGHLLTPHFTQRRELQCSFCPFITRDAKQILFHMEAHHNKVPTMEPPPQFYECPFCPFETNLKNKAGTHVNRCQRYFNNNVNQSPGNDFQAPGMTSKPITSDDIKMYERFFIALTQAKSQAAAQAAQAQHAAQAAAASAQQRQQMLMAAAANQRNPGNVAQAAQAALNNRGVVGQSPVTGPAGGGPVRPQLNAASVPTNVQNAHPNSHLAQNHAALYQQLQTMAAATAANRVAQAAQVARNGAGRANTATAASLLQQAQALAQVAGAGLLNGNAAALQALSAQNRAAVAAAAANLARVPQQQGMPTRLGTPGSGRAPAILESSGQAGTGHGGQGGAGAFVICEICDGYIKDLEQLRTHMQWIHKVKIHPKMLNSRPPLSCQKCQWRFFTDQGLERHLLGAHGLVTSNMQELANNGQDGGRCTVCGRIYASKLVAHMSQVHRVVLKPAHLSYKCTVCTATFNLYGLFESHVYSVHSGAMKRGSSSGSGGASAGSGAGQDASAVKRRKEDSLPAATGGAINAAAHSQFQARSKDDFPKTCKLCGDMKVDDFLTHIGEKHMPKSVKVGVCQIDKCGSCLSNFDGMVVMNSDMGESSSSSGSEDEDD